ncbi:MAG: hypothetical protein U0V72_10215 [Cytophagales bacterium]
MKKTRLYKAYLFVGLLAAFVLSAQDLGKIDYKKPVVVTGGFSATQTLYAAEGIKARRDPYYWMLSANLNINLFGVLSIPLSGQLTQQNKSYTQPFNQYGLSPSYKTGRHIWAIVVCNILVTASGAISGMVQG